MKQVAAGILLFVLLLCSALTSCDIPREEDDKNNDVDYVEYHVTEVKKTWGDDKFAMGKEIDYSYKLYENGVDSIKLTLNDGRIINLKYQYTADNCRVYEFKVKGFSASLYITMDTCDLRQFSVVGGNANDFDYESIYNGLKTKSEYVERLGVFALALGINDLDSYECEFFTEYSTDSNSVYYSDDEFIEFPSNDKQWREYSFCFSKQDDVVASFTNKFYVTIGKNKFSVYIDQPHPYIKDSAVNIKEVKDDVEAYVRANFDPNYPVGEVMIDDYQICLTYYDGRLCCVIDEFFIRFTNTKDGKQFDDHIHCGAIVFLE